MSNNAYKTASKRNYLLLLFSLIIVVLFSFVVAPIFVNLNSNAIYAESIISTLLYYISHFLEYTYVAFLFAFIACGEFIAYKNNSSKNIYIILAIVAIIFKHLSNCVFSLIVDGGSFWLVDVVSLSLYAAIDICVIVIAKLTSKSSVKGYASYSSAVSKAMRRLETDKAPEAMTVYPFPSIISLKNPVLSPIFIASVSFAATGLIEQIVLLPVVFDSPEGLGILLQSFIMNVFFTALGYIIAYFGSKFVLSSTIETSKPSTNSL